MSKVPTCEDVNDEVHGGVEDGQGVADGRVVVVPPAADPRLLVDDGPEDHVDEGRGLADDEDAHDDDQDQGDVLLVPALPHLGPTSLASLQRHDQPDVEEDDREEWPAVNEDRVENVGVDDTVELVAAERADLEHVLGRVVAHAHLGALVLEESRNVVEHGEDGDDRHTDARLPGSVDLRRCTERSADGAVPVAWRRARSRIWWRCRVSSRWATGTV